jgi:hypothetical protein
MYTPSKEPILLLSSSLRGRFSLSFYFVIPFSCTHDILLSIDSLSLIFADDDDAIVSSFSIPTHKWMIAVLLAGAMEITTTTTRS